MAGDRTFLLIEHPVIDPKRMMQPEGVIQASDLQLGIKNCPPMRKERGIEQRHIRQISKERAVQRLIIR